jgi:hypothetical protein
MSNKETEQEQPEELSRDQFFHRLGIAESSFKAKLEDVVISLRTVNGMRNDIFESEHDGLKLRFYEDGRRLFFTTEPKGQIGFRKEPHGKTHN